MAKAKSKSGITPLTKPGHNGRHPETTRDKDRKPPTITRKVG